MADESKLLEVAAQGERASIALQVLGEVIQKTIDDLRAASEETRFEETERREFIHVQIRSLRSIREHLEKRVIAGNDSIKELIRKKDASRLRKVING